VLKFKRVLHEGMRGRDVSAVKIALGRAGFGPGYVRYHSRRFGPAMKTNLKRFQRHEGIRADGVYGPKTHAALTPHFSAYARWLYNRQRVAPPSYYVNPFHASSGLEVGRVDMGVDYHGRGAISAIGDAEIVGFAGAGWPDGEYVLYRLLDGPHAGRYVYVAEGIVPAVRPGQRVKRGETIGHFAPNAAPGLYPGIETGWGSSVPGLTRAAETGQIGGANHSFSPAGVAFARFLKGIGAPAPSVWSGPEYV
jgi:hypothetical protein